MPNRFETPNLTSLLEISLYIRDYYHILFGQEPKLVTDTPVIIINGRFVFGCATDHFFVEQRMPKFEMIHTGIDLGECMSKLFTHIYAERLSRILEDLKFKESERKSSHDSWSILDLRQLR